MVKISNLLRLIAKPIFLKLGKGLKSSKTQYCLGDELDIRLDDSVIGKDNVIAKPPTKPNSLVRWVDGDAKQIKDSKTIQNDDGNTSTRTSIDGTLSYITSNESQDPNSSAVHAIESKGGRPINRLFIPGKQLVDSYIDNKDYSYNIFLNDIENKGLAATCLRINRKGKVSHPFQFRALALLPSSTPRVTGNGTLYKHGSTTALTVLKDVGSQFYPGDGQGKPATFSVYEDNTYLMYMHMTFNSFEDKPGEIINRILSQNGRIYNGRGILAGGLGNNSVGLLIGIDAVMGDIFEFATLGFMSPNELRVSFSGTPFPNLTTYIGVYCLG